MPKQFGRLGMIKVDPFCHSSKSSLHRRLKTSESTWAKLHKAETMHYTFHLIYLEYNCLVKAKNMCNNLVWKEIYVSLLVGTRNVLETQPEIFLILPIITKHKKRLL